MLCTVFRVTAIAVLLLLLGSAPVYAVSDTVRAGGLSLDIDEVPGDGDSPSQAAILIGPTSGPAGLGSFSSAVNLFEPTAAGAAFSDVVTFTATENPNARGSFSWSLELKSVNALCISPSCSNHTSSERSRAFRNRRLPRRLGHPRH
jgi:hypothetical protein